MACATSPAPTLCSGTSPYSQEGRTRFREQGIRGGGARCSSGMSLDTHSLCYWLWKLALCQRGTVRIAVPRQDPRGGLIPSLLCRSGPNKSFVECFECFTLTWGPNSRCEWSSLRQKFICWSETLTWLRPNTEGCPCPAEPSPQHIPRQIDVGDREYHADHNHNADTSMVSQCLKITTPSLTTSQAPTGAHNLTFPTFFFFLFPPVL